MQGPTSTALLATMRFEAHGRKYSVMLNKGVDRTTIKGRGWKKFTSDFHLGDGELVVFDMSKHPRKAFVCFFSGGNDTDDEAPADEMDVEEDSSDEDDEEEDASSEEDQEIVQTRGANLADDE